MILFDRMNICLRIICTYHDNNVCPRAISHSTIQILYIYIDTRCSKSLLEYLVMRIYVGQAWTCRLWYGRVGRLPNQNNGQVCTSKLPSIVSRVRATIWTACSFINILSRIVGLSDWFVWAGLSSQELGAWPELALCKLVVEHLKTCRQWWLRWWLCKNFFILPSAGKSSAEYFEKKSLVLKSSWSFMGTSCKCKGFLQQVPGAPPAEPGVSPAGARGSLCMYQGFLLQVRKGPSCSWQGVPPPHRPS